MVAPYSTPWTVTAEEPTMSVSALKNGGPASEPTLPSSRVPRAKMMVMGAQTPLRRPLRVGERFWRGWRGVGKELARWVRRVVRRRRVGSMLVVLLGFSGEESRLAFWFGGLGNQRAWKCCSD